MRFRLRDVTTPTRFIVFRRYDLELEEPLSPKQASPFLGCSPRSAGRLMKSGELVSFKVGGRWKTTLSYIIAFRNRNVSSAIGDDRHQSRD